MLSLERNRIAEVTLPGDDHMNVNESALEQSYRLAAASGKVDAGRLAKALALVTQVRKTFAHIYTDHSRVEEYWVPGSAHTGYVVTVKNQKHVSSCTCKDSQERETVYCKHRLSIMLILKAEQLVPGSATDNTPTPVSDRMASLLADPEYRKRTLANMFQDAD